MGGLRTEYSNKDGWRLTPGADRTIHLRDDGTMKISSLLPLLGLATAPANGVARLYSTTQMRQAGALSKGILIWDPLSGLDSLEQTVNQIPRGVIVHRMRPIRMDKYHVAAHSFEPLFKLDAHDA